MTTTVQIATGAKAEEMVAKVRERYGKIAEGASTGCCGPSSCGSSPLTDEGAVAQSMGYSAEELAQLPEGANLGLGCGAPLRFLELKAGERVLDLGSGAGLDAFLAAKQVGATGHVIGVDMTPAMLDKARRGAEKLRLPYVEFREGRLEALPVEKDSVDAVTSNCVINLVPDKGAVFREVARVLRPGGRLVVSDILLDGTLPEAIASDVFAYVGCISGALDRDAYFGLLRSAGLGKVEILRDADYLAGLRDSAPHEVDALLSRFGLRFEDVAGKVRSVTFRALKA